MPPVKVYKGKAFVALAAALIAAGACAFPFYVRYDGGPAVRISSLHPHAPTSPRAGHFPNEGGVSSRNIVSLKFASKILEPKGLPPPSPSPPAVYPAAVLRASCCRRRPVSAGPTQTRARAGGRPTSALLSLSLLVQTAATLTHPAVQGVPFWIQSLCCMGNRCPPFPLADHC